MARKGTKSDRQLNQIAVTEEFQQSNEFADTTKKNICIENIFQDYGSFENVNNDKIICFNVSKTYLRAQNADLVFAVCSGYIIGVFKPIRWYPTTSEKYKGRWEFDGEEIVDSPFINMDISHLTGRRQNPVMYLNM